MAMSTVRVTVLKAMATGVTVKSKDYLTTKR
jgi:hypothetical protein